MDAYFEFHYVYSPVVVFLIYDALATSNLFWITLGSTYASTVGRIRVFVVVNDAGILLHDANALHDNLFELVCVGIVAYVFAFGNFLSFWSLGCLALLGQKGMFPLLMFIIRYGRLILVGFLMVAPNGIGHGVVVSLLGLGVTAVVGNGNVFIMIIALVALVYIL